MNVFFLFEPMGHHEENCVGCETTTPTPEKMTPSPPVPSRTPRNCTNNKQTKTPENISFPRPQNKDMKKESVTETKTQNSFSEPKFILAEIFSVKHMIRGKKSFPAPGVNDNEVSKREARGSIPLKYGLDEIQLLTVVAWDHVISSLIGSKLAHLIEHSISSLHVATPTLTQSKYLLTTNLLNTYPPLLRGKCAHNVIGVICSLLVAPDLIHLGLNDKRPRRQSTHPNFWMDRSSGGWYTPAVLTCIPVQRVPT